MSTVMVTGCWTPPPGSNPCHAAVDAVWQRDLSWAHGVVNRESHGIQNARNKSGASGCFQLMPVHRDLVPGGWSMVMVAHNNVSAAWSLYSGSGRRPWQ